MKVSETKRNIVIVSCSQEKPDPDYGTCLWADFIFDTDTYTLNINSDCGDFSYGWNVTSTEPFLKLMARINRDYLLTKIASCNCVAVDATMKKIEYEFSISAEADEGSRILENVRERVDEYSDNYDACVEKLIDILCEEGYGEDGGLDYESVSCAMESKYPPQAERIADIFADYIQPFIRKRMDNEV
jgi:hypothetical protein